MAINYPRQTLCRTIGLAVACSTGHAGIVRTLQHLSEEDVTNTWCRQCVSVGLYMRVCDCESCAGPYLITGHTDHWVLSKGRWVLQSMLSLLVWGRVICLLVAVWMKNVLVSVVSLNLHVCVCGCVCVCVFSNVHYFDLYFRLTVTMCWPCIFASAAVSSALFLSYILFSHTSHSLVSLLFNSLHITVVSLNFLPLKLFISALSHILSSMISGSDFPY